jgi:hypothetical protein
MKKIITLAAVSLIMTGCATTSMYDWGNYEDSLFDYYHQPENKEKVITALVEHVEDVHRKGEKVAPGLFAEAGTFFLLEGNSARAIEFYKLEAAEWPESEPMMSKLISNLEK